MAYTLIRHLGGAPFSWGGASLGETGQLRSADIAALREAKAQRHEKACWKMVIFQRSDNVV
jgi:hypothetical protein